MEKKLDLRIPSPIFELHHPILDAFDIRVSVKRDDLIHEVISGNKWRKLKLNIEKYYEKGYEKLLTYGGAYSNHIAATAQVGKELGVPTIGIIRGDELNPSSNQTLALAKENGMQLIFVSRSEYAMRYENDYKNELRARFGRILIVEEGGANFLGVMGCTEIVSELKESYDAIFLAAGTGTTTAGVLLATDNVPVYSVPVLKNGGFIHESVSDLLMYSGLTDEIIAEYLQQLKLLTNYHFGGYGKYTDELISFMNDVYAVSSLKLDQVYTAKALYALFSEVKNNRIAPGSKLLFIHTGGLQGAQGISDRLDYTIED
ncbi:MAG: 1-aminocyclopropane-1-carboxylate deaminase/D-cysteine desulfhydrase [Crocinitomicaceae bacterium]